MGLEWNWVAVPGLVGGALALLAAGFVYYNSAGLRTARYLSLVLFLEGSHIACGNALVLMATDLPTARGFMAVTWAVRIAIGAVYLSFLATLGVRWIGFLDRPWARFAYIGATLAAVFAFLANPASLMVNPGPRWFAAWFFDAGPFHRFLVAEAGSIFVLSLAVALSAYFQAQSSTARRKAKAYVIAFGARDAMFVVFFAGLVMIGNPVNDGVVHTWDLWIFWGDSFAIILYVILLAYGILHSNLFDLDLRIKRAIKPGAVGATFVVVFLVVTQVAQNGLSSRFGWIWGGVAAGLLLFALAPLMRVAERLAHAAMPNVNATDEYLAHRRADVYKGALEEILVDATVSPKERAILERLQEKLGLATATAKALERDVVAAASVGFGKSSSFS